MPEGGQRTSVRNWRTMAVFLGPRHITAEEREGRRKAREMAWRAPIGWAEVGLVESVNGGRPF